MVEHTIKNKYRKSGIELLRILSMCMVVILHTLVQGGILRNSSLFSMEYELGWLMEISCFCAVNCYALITGYVMCKSKVKYHKIILL